METRLKFLGEQKLLGDSGRLVREMSSDLIATKYEPVEGPKGPKVAQACMRIKFHRFLKELLCHRRGQILLIVRSLQ